MAVAMVAALVALIGPASALAAPPTVTTGSATTSGDTKATLNGTVNPQGSETTYKVEYGPTTSYGNTVPFYGASAGSGSFNLPVKQSVTGLTPGTLYHYRITAMNASGTTNGSDATFTSGSTVLSTAVFGMKTTEPFDGSAGSLASFGSNWSALGWAAGKGEDSVGGWHPTAESPTVNGAYFNQTLTETGQGMAVQATMATSPGAGTPRYFSVWLDMSNPAGASRSGYELRFVYTAPGTYTASLFKWVSGTPSSLGSKAGVSLAAGEGIALTDKGSSVQAWIRGAASAASIISASDSTYSSGKTGVEGVGNVTRLTNFKVGPLLTPVENMNASLKSLPLRDAFTTVESPLSGGGAWSALAWDNSGSGHNTGQVSSLGWGSFDAPPTINGAYWAKAPFADLGAGNAVTVMLSEVAETGQSFSLWLDMPSPGSEKTGYELRVKQAVAPYLYEVRWTRWLAGKEMASGTNGGYLPLVPGFQLAFVDKGSLSVWATDSEGVFKEWWPIADSTYSSGYSGIQASSAYARLRDFRAGQLPPF